MPVHALSYRLIIYSFQLPELLLYFVNPLIQVQTCRKLNPIVSTPQFHLRSLGSVFHRSRKEHFTGKFDPVSPKTVHTQFGQDQSYSTCSDAFELTARLVKLLFPWVLDMNTQGFRVCELIHEARCSVNNLYWVIACSVLMPLSAALLQLLLLSAGLPSLPLVLANASSSSVHLVWLPQQQFRTQLMFLPYQQMWNSSWESFLSPDVIHFNSAYCIPSYGVGQLVWLILIVTPVLSLSMLDRRVDLLRPLQEPPVKRRTSFDLKMRNSKGNSQFLGVVGHLVQPIFPRCFL
ncbi:hypothetical protein EG68_12409 [Paragonimus skrjabini miyazakii]|uniref:Uncharacterized protein n=1 Tax=Paragonimus skrjabini miyazakii TaxID=59628 RepID=A0A8S9YCB2_9TREM|nr:hypothetical protein EG68_12409 [Paragonimus skrjabini miyazakii]